MQRHVAAQNQVARAPGRLRRVTRPAPDPACPVLPLSFPFPWAAFLRLSPLAHQQVSSRTVALPPFPSTSSSGTAAIPWLPASSTRAPIPPADPVQPAPPLLTSQLSIPPRQFGSCSKTSCKQLFNWRFRGHHAVASDIRVRVRSGILQQFLAIKRQQHWLDRTPEAGLEIVLPVG